MKIIKHDQFFKDRELRKWIIHSVKNGSIVIYPTDTIYGIGCDVGNASSVREIQDAKKRTNPFSIVAPSIKWIEQNLEIPRGSKTLVRKSLPGPFTFIMRPKPGKKLPGTAVSGQGTVGVRIPDNYFTDVMRKEGILLVTTSVNVHGKEPARSIGDIPKSIAKIVDIAIDAGPISNPPSSIIDLTSKKPNVIR
jgi:L-threonylcarbamoyladenylate synthase